MPFVIEEVFLFDARGLLDQLAQRGAKIGIATSVRSREWDDARIYPQSLLAPLAISLEQARLLELFRR